LDKAEDGLRDLEKQRKAEEADFRKQQQDLERRQETAAATYVAARKRANVRIPTKAATFSNLIPATIPT
jgi:predicted DNA binding CopG/RHH family protein